MRYLVVLLLFGCAGVPPRLAWVNPSRNHDFKMDRYECERDARTAGVVGSGLMAGSVVTYDDDFWRLCMDSRGWRQVNAADLEAVDAGPIRSPPGKVEGLKKLE